MTDYKAALSAMRANMLSVWSPKKRDEGDRKFASNRIHEGFAKIKGIPGFKLEQDATFFCVGSCFAREIEDAITDVGFGAATKSMFLKAIEEHPDLFAREEGVVGRPHAFLNRYNLGSMSDLMEIISNSSAEDEGLYYPAGLDKFHDYHYTRLFKSNTIDVCRKRREVINATYRKAAYQADVFVFTFGLCESFYDNKISRFLNVTPDPKTASKQDLSFRFISYEENLKYGEKIISSILKINPNAKIVITVSPVPLDATFTSHDIVVANNLAKSTLVLAAHSLVDKYPQCDYFPSFEMVMNSQKSEAWLWDKKHVAPNMVKHIMNSFVSEYV